MCIYSAFNLEEPLFCGFVNNNSFYHKIVTVASITLKLVHSFHISFYSVCASSEECPWDASKVRKDQVTGGRICQVAKVFKPGKVHLAELRTVTLQPARTMVHLSPQQVWKLNSLA